MVEDNSPLAGEPNKLETLAEDAQKDPQGKPSPLAGEPNKLETGSGPKSRCLMDAPHSLGNPINWKPWIALPPPKYLVSNRNTSLAA